eukprot:3934094-Rhodomonas_salina.4
MQAPALGAPPSSRGERYLFDDAGRANLWYCGTGYLLVNDSAFPARHVAFLLAGSLWKGKPAPDFGMEWQRFRSSSAQIATQRPTLCYQRTTASQMEPAQCGDFPLMLCWLWRHARVPVGLIPMASLLQRLLTMPARRSLRGRISLRGIGWLDVGDSVPRRREKYPLFNFILLRLPRSVPQQCARQILLSLSSFCPHAMIAQAGSMSQTRSMREVSLTSSGKTGSSSALPRHVLSGGKAASPLSRTPCRRPVSGLSRSILRNGGH